MQTHNTDDIRQLADEATELLEKARGKFVCADLGGLVEAVEKLAAGLRLAADRLENTIDTSKEMTFGGGSF